jgi:hypothetical protein
MPEALVKSAQANPPVRCFIQRKPAAAAFLLCLSWQRLTRSLPLRVIARDGFDGSVSGEMQALKKGGAFSE